MDTELEGKVTDSDEVKVTEDEVKDTVKVSVVGDSGVGKTCMLMRFVNKKYPDEDEKINRHSLFENTSGTIHGKNEPVREKTNLGSDQDPGTRSNTNRTVL